MSDVDRAPVFAGKAWPPHYTYVPALRVGDATPKAAPGKDVAEAAKPAAAPAGNAKSAPKPSATVAQSRKMDIRTAMLYSKALEEEDAGNKTKAVELYKQVVSKFPDFAPAQSKISKLGG